MRVLLLGNAQSIHLVRWANALCERGVDVVVASLSPPAEGTLSARLPFELLPMGVPMGYLAAVPALRRLPQRHAPDVVHAHYASGYGTLVTLARLRPRVVSVWGSDVYLFPRVSPLHRALVRHTLSSADVVCSTSEAMARHAGDLAGRSDLAITPFGVDVDAFRPAQYRTRTDIVVGTVKSLHPLYGVDVLVRAFANVRRSLGTRLPAVAARLRLVIAGDGPQRSELERLVERCGVAGVTSMLGRVPHREVPDVLRGFDVYVAASRGDESFGVAILEALACEVPVVVTSVPGFVEVVPRDVAGRFVPPDDVVATATAIEELVSSPGLRVAMGRAGRRHVVERYAWASSVDVMLGVYERVLAGGAHVSQSTNARRPPA